MAQNDRISGEHPGGGLADLRAGRARALRQRKAKFLTALGQTSNVTTSAKAASVSLRSVARWKQEDATFKAAFKNLDETMVIEAADRIRELMRSTDQRVSLRAAQFILERRSRSTWGQHFDPAGNASALEIAQALRTFQLDVEASVPPPRFPPEAEI